MSDGKPDLENEDKGSHTQVVERDYEEFESDSPQVDLPASGSQKRSQESGGKEKTVEVEHSFSMRVAAFAMVISVITGACMYANTIPAMVILYLWMAGMGIFLSYRYRQERPIWVTAVPVIGAMIVIGAFVTITAQQIMSHNVNFLIPFLQVLAGLQALHCFDLRTREDFSISVLIALGVFTFTAAAATDYLFILLALSFILSLSFLLYFDAVSRSQGVGPSRPVGEGRPGSMPKPKPIVSRGARAASVAIVLPVVCVPVMTLLTFYLMPRSESLIEFIMRDLIGPHFAISNSSKGTGYNPNVNRPGMGRDPLGIAKGADQPGGQGLSKGRSGGQGGEAGGDPKKGVGPLGREKGDGKDVNGIAGQDGSASEEDFEETVEQEPEKVDLLQSDLPMDKVVMRIHSARPGYTRRTTYDFYNGRSWSRSGPISGVKFRKDRGNVFGVGNANALLVPNDCPTVQVRQQITVDFDAIGKFLPAFWIPQAVGGDFDNVTVQADGSLRVDKSVPAGVTYEVDSLLPIYKIESMRALPLRTHSHFKESILGPSVTDMESGEEELIQRYLQLPENISPKVLKLAKSVAGQKGNWFVRAENIAKYLRKKCKYDLKAKNRSEDGDFVYNFLYKTREGNCLEFSSAFVVMCRAAGIPARCVGGYLPGQLNKKTGFYEVRVKDGHAWAEVYLPDWSWIPFDATPVGTYPEVEKDENVFSKLAELGFSNPFGGVLSTPSASLGAGLGKGISGSELDKKIKGKEASANGEGESAPEENNPGEILAGLAEFRWEPVAAIFIFAASVLVGFIYLRQRKAEEKEQIPENARRSTLIYLELLGDLKRYRVVRMPSDSPAEFQLRLKSALEAVREEGSQVPGELEPMLSHFLEVYNKERFGREERVDELESMHHKIRELVKSSKIK